MSSASVTWRRGTVSLSRLCVSRWTSSSAGSGGERLEEEYEGALEEEEDELEDEGDRDGDLLRRLLGSLSGGDRSRERSRRDLLPGTVWI